MKDVGFAQARQHRGNVRQKEPVGAKNRHPQLFLPTCFDPVRVQQIGQSVQRDDRLARSRAALNQQELVVGADEFVLLSLNGGHDWP